MLDLFKEINIYLNELGSSPWERHQASKGPGAKCQVPQRAWVRYGVFLEWYFVAASSFLQEVRFPLRSWNVAKVWITRLTSLPDDLSVYRKYGLLFVCQFWDKHAVTWRECVRCSWAFLVKPSRLILLCMWKGCMRMHKQRNLSHWQQMIYKRTSLNICELWGIAYINWWRVIRKLLLLSLPLFSSLLNIETGHLANPGLTSCFYFDLNPEKLPSLLHF